jgi:hypothetical protein
MFEIVEVPYNPHVPSFIPTTRVSLIQSLMLCSLTVLVFQLLSLIVVSPQHIANIIAFH